MTYELPPVDGLSEAQADGRECVYCAPGHGEGVMIPVGLLRGTMLFAHRECASEHVVTDD